MHQGERERHDHDRCSLGEGRRELKDLHPVRRLGEDRRREDEHHCRQGQRTTGEIHAQQFAPTVARNQSIAPTGIAVVPVYGTLVRRALGLDAASGLASYSELGAMLDAAAADPDVSGILLDIDSPGGEAGGVFELAQRVRAADAIKPVWAIASDSAYSAAYAIACAASRVFITQTGGVGSIGVIAMHVD